MYLYQLQNFPCSRGSENDCISKNSLMQFSLMFSARKSFHQDNWSCNHFKEVSPTQWTLVLRKTGRVQWLAGKLHADISVRVTLLCLGSLRKAVTPSITGIAAYHSARQNHRTTEQWKHKRKGERKMKRFRLRKKSSTQGPISGQNICLTVGTSQSTVFIVGGTEEVSEGYVTTEIDSFLCTEIDSFLCKETLQSCPERRNEIV